MSFTKRSKKKGNTLTIKINMQAIGIAQEGMDFISQGDMKGAEKAFRRALEIEPETSDALFGMGLVNQQRGMLDDAVEYYRQAFRADLTNTDALFNIGAIHMFRQEIEEAIPVFKLLQDLTPEDPQVYLNLGSLYLANQQPKEAICSLEEALRLDPDYAKAKILMTQAKQKFNF